MYHRHRYKCIYTHIHIQESAHLCKYIPLRSFVLLSSCVRAAFNSNCNSFSLILIDCKIEFKYVIIKSYYKMKIAYIYTRNTDIYPYI